MALYLSKKQGNNALDMINVHVSGINLVLTS